MTAPVLTDAQFGLLRSLLAQAAGLAFSPSRRDALGYCVAERIRATGARDVDAYLALTDDPRERQHLLDEVTIQETHFFRNPPQVRALRQHVLPALLRAAEGSRRLRVWSAGCSTGEEPYTIAMLLRELVPDLSGWDVKVVGTDVSERALAAARTGRYGPRAVQRATPQDLARHFTVQPDGSALVRPEVRELVELRHHNLVTEPVPYGPQGLDLVLCRNVTIYFDRSTTRSLMERLHAGLVDGGYLLLGHSETLWQVSDSFRLVPLGADESAAFVYRRLDEPRSRTERRTVLPDRRTGRVEGDPAADERRRGPRRELPPHGDLLRGAPSPPQSPSPSPSPTALPSRPHGGRTGQAAVPAPRSGPPGTDGRHPVAEVDLDQVRAALADGRYGDAVALADVVLGATPLSAPAQYLRGLALVSLGDDPAALVALRKATYLDATSGLAHFLLAGALERTGDRPAARREYRAAASTLAAGDAEAPELGGRSLVDLVSLCLRLARHPDEEHA